MTRKENAPSPGRGNCVADTHNSTANPTATQCTQSAVVRFVCGRIVENLQGRDTPFRLDCQLGKFKKQGFTRADFMKAVSCLIDSEVVQSYLITVTRYVPGRRGFAGHNSERKTVVISLPEARK